MAFEELKAKQSVIWGSGPYERVSEQHLNVIEHLLDRLAIKEGERLLDVATGTGEVARPAARAGAIVTGLDLAPDLIERARKRAADDGVEVRFEVGDAEHLPYETASFDVVTSTFGVMFAPDQRAVATELARVTRPGGRLGLATWPPEGGVADMFRVMAPYQPPRPDGVGNPFDWGREEHVTDLLRDDFILTFARGQAPQDGTSGEEMWELMSTWYGPTKALASSLDPKRRAQLAREFAALYRPDGARVTLQRPYVLVCGIRR